MSDRLEESQLINKLRSLESSSMNSTSLEMTSAIMNSLFRVSARNHTGLILMAELARTKDDERRDVFVSLKEVAEKMGLSQGFLEEVATDLKKAKLIQGRKGPGGGYRLAKPANKITAGEILTALEGPVSMIGCTCGPCPKKGCCMSKSLWSFLHRDILKSLKKTTLAKIVETKI